jgi:uncharacterized protein (TIGR00369 family)
MICPTGSNPYELIREIRLLNYREKGARCTLLITKEIQYNLMSIGLEIDTEIKKLDLTRYENPPKSDKMFYVGCGIPYIFPDLAKTKLFESLPILGGMKYCCGSYVYSCFGRDEARTKGLELFEKFKELGVEKLITFCPGCDAMIKGIYPSIIEGFYIEGQTIIDYLIEKYHGGVLYSMADTGMGAALYSLLESDELCATVEIKISYFKSVKEGTLICDTKVIHKGKTIGALDSEIANNETLVAKASGTFSIFKVL